MGRRYYPGLSGLRAIAALTVLFTHVERLRAMSGMSLLISTAFNSFLGGLAVTFFFVLSGFLITLLLLNEKAAEGTIRVRRFLANRALRIWPLYYVTLVGGYAISIFLLRDTGTDPVHNGFLLNLFLLPNVVFVLGWMPDIVTPLWSIGPEEQFYLVWPFLVRRFSIRALPRLFMAIIVFWSLIRLPLRMLHGEGALLNSFFFRTRIDCMAIGGLAGLLLFHAERSVGWWTRLYRIVLHPVTGWAAALFFFVLLAISDRYTIGLYPAYALLFALCCLRVTGLPVRWLEWAPLRWLGKVSYGIYLLHMFVLFLLFRVWFIRHPLHDIAIFIVAAILTTGLAALSYTFFERIFLRKQIRLPAPSPGPTLS